jgi:acetyl esterase/lipase
VVKFRLIDFRSRAGGEPSLIARPMLRWILFSLTLLTTVIALFTVVNWPSIPGWLLALASAELGHFLALLTVALLVAAFTVGSVGPLRWPVLGLGLVSLVLLLRPAWLASRLAGELPGKLQSDFGPAASARAAFSWMRLFVPATTPSGPVATHIYAANGMTLDFYAPVPGTGSANGATNAPCVIVIHGGGWDGGKKEEFGWFNRHLSARGFAVAAIEYRLAPQFPWPAPRDDVRAAVAWLKAHAAELRIDPTRLVLFGRSAGGSIAEAVAYGSPDPAIRGVAAFYAPADLHYAWITSKEGDVLDPLKLLRQYLGGSPEQVPAAYEAASGYLQVRRGAPPTLLVHGDRDVIVWHRQSERLAERLAENNVPHALISLPWATHGFEFYGDSPSGQLAMYALESFLATVTK